MSIEPFFSIIIPTYNRAHTIRKAIDSIINQSYGDWELIIVDDGSTDNTKSVVDSYTDPRIKYVWQENQERSAARNHGIKLANGEWICFQDSDDEYLPDHLEVLYDGICHFPEYKVFRTGMYIYINGKLAKTPKFDVKNEYELYPFDAFQAFAIHSNILKEIKFETIYFNSEDLHLLIRINEKFPMKVICKYTNLYNYDIRNSSGIGNDYFKIHTNKIMVFNALIKKPGNIKIKYLKRKICLSSILILIGDIKFKRSYVIKSLTNLLFIIIKMPIPFTILLCRILYVKFGEWSGFYQIEERF